MKQIKLPNNIKEILTTYGVPSDAVKIVEAHYSGIIHEVANEDNKASKEDEPVDEEKDFRNKAREIAEQERVVK